MATHGLARIMIKLSLCPHLKKYCLADEAIPVLEFAYTITILHT